MEFTGRRVQFWLSPGAREALGDLVPVGRGFEALVVEEDGLGLWLWIPDAERKAGEDSVQVILLKWEYFAAASLEYRPQAPTERSRAGFQRPS